MRRFSSEVGHNYGTYTFAYAHYAQREPGDSLGLIYRGGYLPYSGSADATDIFYQARSARVLLKDFALTSENRRIAKKFDGLFTKTRVPLADFKADEAFYDFCLQYFAARHGASAMPRARLEYLMRCRLITTVVEYRQDGKPVAYVLEVGEGALGHYWFSFYDLFLTYKSLGMWLMLDNIRGAKERGLEHYYLGTVYGEKALYKTNFSPLEWWDGESWSSDVAALKERGRRDGDRALGLTDEWKSDFPLF